MSVGATFNQVINALFVREGLNTSYSCLILILQHGVSANTDIITIPYLQHAARRSCPWSRHVGHLDYKFWPISDRYPSWVSDRAIPIVCPIIPLSIHLFHPYLRGSFRLTRAPPSQCRSSICGEFQVKANDPKVESPTVDRLTKIIVKLIVEPGSIGIKSLETGYCIFFSTAFHHLD